MKIKHILLALSTVALLASCGEPTVSKEDAQKNLATTAKKVADGEVKVPGALTLTETVTGDGKDVNAVFAINTTEKYYHVKSDETEVWMYAEGEKFVVAAVSGDAKHYLYASAAQFDAAIKEQGASIDALVTECYDMFSSIFVSDYSSQGAAMASVSAEGVNVKKNEISEKYTSSGEGNLTVDLKVDVDVETEVLGVKSETAMYVAVVGKIDNYLPVSVDATIKMTMTGVTGGGAGNMDATAKMTFDWGKCAIEKPDLSQFTPANA